MKRYVLPAAAVTLFLGHLALAEPEAPASKTAPGFALEIKIAPKESAPGQFVCEASVTDLATGKVIAAPRIEFLQGKSSTTISDDATGRRDVQLTAGVEGNATRATYALEVHEGETLLASQKGSIKLR
ncbi:MAG: hypothetical protein ACM3SU_12865 [Acidobacteriota bacterium]